VVRERAADAVGEVAAAADRSLAVTTGHSLAVTGHSLAVTGHSLALAVTADLASVFGFARARSYRIGGDTRVKARCVGEVGGSSVRPDCVGDRIIGGGGRPRHR